MKKIKSIYKKNKSDKIEFAKREFFTVVGTSISTFFSL